MQHLDKQLSKYSFELNSDIGINIKDTNRIATTIYIDALNFSLSEVESIKNSSPISLKERFEELLVFKP